jgi:bifunctional non-homologous end joining protein LigD
MYLANQACITPHISLSRKDQLAHPDQMILDLDPSTEDFANVRAAALDLRAFLEELDVVPFVKTTGSRGLHVVVPLRRKDDYDDVGLVAERIAIRFAQQSPKTLTIEFRKAKRDGRIFVDWMRNNWAQTAVAPYALRPLPGAPVAMPLYWDEVEDSSLVPGRYKIKDAPRVIDDGHDPWQGWRRRARTLAGARRKLAVDD